MNTGIINYYAYSFRNTIDDVKGENKTKLVRDRCNYCCLLIILMIVCASLLLNLVVYFYLLPEQLNNFTYEINKIQKYENEIDDINAKFRQIYNIVENLCKLDVFKKYCNNTL